jgi:hypothetical protein
MKKLRIIAILAFAALTATSCYTVIETELNALDRRVENLEQRVYAINNNISSLQTLADKYKSYIYVLSTRPIYQGKEIVGYKIELTDGSSLTLMNGVSKDDPIVGLTLDEDGLYYWTVTVNGVTDYFYDEVGQKIAASVASPIMKIVDDVWKVSFDNGYIWQTFDRARGADGYSYIDSIVTRNDYVNIYLASGQTVSFPSYSLYENYVEQLTTLNLNMEALRVIYEAKAAAVYVQTVVPIVENGKNVGYKLVFSDSSTISVYDGKRYEGGNDIGLVQHTDGKYYWAIVKDGKTEWLYDDIGDMVQASPSAGVAPIFMLEADGDGKYYWCYKYGADGYKRYLYDAEGKKVAASNTNIIQVFASVEVTDNYVTFTPLGGTPFSVPRYQTFSVQFSSTSVKIPASGSKDVNYRVTSVPASAAITAIAGDGYHAITTKSYSEDNRALSGVITLTADDTAADSSSVLVLVSDGLGHMEKFTIDVAKE